MEGNKQSKGSRLKARARLGSILLFCTVIAGIGVFILVYWLKYKSFPWRDFYLSRTSSDYEVTTDIEPTEESDNVVDSLVENVEQEEEDFSILAYGDITYKLGNNGEIISGTFTLKGVYKGYNVRRQTIMIELDESGEILAFGNDDVDKMYFFPKDITVDLEITNAGLALRPGTTFPLTEEGKKVYKIEDTKNVPEGVDVLVYGDVDYAEGSKITYDVIEFYEMQP